MELGEWSEEVKKRGYGVVAISYDTQAALKNFADRKQLNYPLLSDPDSNIIKSFGILNEKAKDMAAGIPHPGLFVVDSAGKVEAKYFEEDFRERFTISALLAGRFGKTGLIAGEQVAAKRARITPSASATTVRGGEHILLTLEVDLGPGLHAYAAGAGEDYIAVDWKGSESTAYRFGAVDAGKPKMLKVGGDPQPVPVYEGKFQLRRELVLNAQAMVQKTADAEGKIHVPATFKYQTCSDRLCYPPETVAVEWVLRFDGHDSARVPAEMRRK